MPNGLVFFRPKANKLNCKLLLLLLFLHNKNLECFKNAESMTVIDKKGRNVRTYCAEEILIIFVKHNWYWWRSCICCLSLEPGLFSQSSPLHTALHPYVGTPNLIKSQSDFGKRVPKKLNTCLNHSCFFSMKACLNFSVCSARVRLFPSFLLLDVCSDGSPNIWVWFQFSVGTRSHCHWIKYLWCRVHKSFITAGSWYLIWHKVTVAQGEQ